MTGQRRRQVVAQRQPLFVVVLKRKHAPRWAGLHPAGTCPARPHIRWPRFRAGRSRSAHRPRECAQASAAPPGPCRAERSRSPFGTRALGRKVFWLLLMISSCFRHFGPQTSGNPGAGAYLAHRLAGNKQALTATISAWPGMKPPNQVFLYVLFTKYADSWHTQRRTDSRRNMCVVAGPFGGRRVS